MRRLLQSLKLNKGTSLIELIVVMALTSIFVAGCAVIISQTYQVYYRVNGLNEAIQVSDLLLDKIQSELEGAEAKSNSAGVGGGSIEFSQACNHGGSKLFHKIAFRNANGSQMYITTFRQSADGEVEGDGTGYLLLNYQPVTVIRDGTGSEMATFKEMKWMFDEAAYMGMKITDLNFEYHMDGYPENVIKVEVTVRGDFGGYRNTRYIRCYNFTDYGDSIGENVAPPRPDGS